MVPDKIHNKILKYLSKKSFVNVICKIFEKSIEYDFYIFGKQQL